MALPVNQNPLADIQSLMDMFAGKTGTETTSPSTKTTSGNLNMDQMQQMIMNILGGTNGLASLAQGARTNGMYNATATQQLVNDLMTRASTQVMAANAGTTTTTSGETKTVSTPGAIDKVTSGAGLKSLLLAGGASLLGPTIKEVGKQAGITNPGEQLRDLIFKKSSPELATDVATGAFDLASETALAASAGDFEAGAKLAEEMGAGTGGTPIGLVISGANAFSDLLGGDKSVGEVAPGVVNAGLSYLTGGMSTIGDIVSGGAVSHAVDVTTDTVSDLVSNAGSSISDAFSDVGKAAGSVICTELMKQGKLDRQLWESCAWYYKDLSPELISGYHYWAIPYVRLMQKSKLATAIVAPFAKGRYEYVAGKWNLAGWFTVAVGEPVCRFIGRTLARNSLKVA